MSLIFYAPLLSLEICAVVAMSNRQGDSRQRDRDLSVTNRQVPVPLSTKKTTQTYCHVNVDIKEILLNTNKIFLYGFYF